MSVGRKHERVRAALVVSEVALACVLLIGAGLLLHSFLRVLDVDLGFQPSRAAAIKVDYDDGGNAARRGAILHEIQDRVSAIPGVDSVRNVGQASAGPQSQLGSSRQGPDLPEGANDDAFVYVVTPGFFSAMGMRLRVGREINWRDTATSEHVIVINEAAARRDWPDQDPVGRLAEGIGDNGYTGGRRGCRCP